MKIKLGKVVAWATKRLKERSTYVGAAAIATALGADALGVQLNTIGTLVPLVLGGGLISATTSQH